MKVNTLLKYEKDLKLNITCRYNLKTWNITNYCLSAHTIWAILQFDWFPRPILSANITFPQCYGTLSRQVTVKVRSNLQSWFQNFLLTMFACFQAISVPFKRWCTNSLNVQLRSVIRKIVKLTTTTLSSDTFSAIVWEAYMWSSFKHCDVFCLINSKFVSL